MIRASLANAPPAYFKISSNHCFAKLIPPVIVHGSYVATRARVMGYFSDVIREVMSVMKSIGFATYPVHGITFL